LIHEKEGAREGQEEGESVESMLGYPKLRMQVMNDRNEFGR